MHDCALVFVDASPCIFLRLSSCRSLSFVNCVSLFSPVFPSFFFPCAILVLLNVSLELHPSPPPQKRKHRDRYQSSNTSNNQTKQKALSFFFVLTSNARLRVTALGAFSPSFPVLFRATLNHASAHGCRSMFRILHVSVHYQAHTASSRRLRVSMGLLIFVSSHLCSSARGVFWWRRRCKKTGWRTSFLCHGPFSPPLLYLSGGLVTARFCVSDYTFLKRTHISPFFA